MVLVSACKQLQENQAVAWIFKTKDKNPPKQESLVFLETTVHRVGETAENQRKTREKSKVAENQVFWLDFCAKKKNCTHPLRGSLVSDIPAGDGKLVNLFLRWRVHCLHFDTTPKMIWPFSKIAKS